MVFIKSLYLHRKIKSFWFPKKERDVFLSRIYEECIKSDTREYFHYFWQEKACRKGENTYGREMAFFFRKKYKFVCGCGFNL